MKRRCISFKQCLILLAMILVFPCMSHGDQNQTQSIQEQLQNLADDYLHSQPESQHMSAIMLSVRSSTLNTVTVYSGHTEFGGDKLIDSKSLFQIGGITKLFTAIILLQLDATPNLHFSLDDPLKKYLPQYPQWGEVTIKQLLNMTSGIPDVMQSTGANTTNFDYEYAKDPYKQWTTEQILEFVTEEPLNFVPGNGWEFSNTNSLLAGLVISKLTGHTVEEEMNQRFFSLQNPSHLNLTNSFYIAHSYPDNLLNRMVHGYTRMGLFPVNTDMTGFSLSYANAALSNISNTEDIANFTAELLTSNHVLSSMQLTKLMSWVSLKTGKPIVTPVPGDYGFGLGMYVLWSDSGEPDMYFMVGTTQGYRMIDVYVPSNQSIITVAINVNDSTSDYSVNDLLVKVYSIISNINGSPQLPGSGIKTATMESPVH